MPPGTGISVNMTLPGLSITAGRIHCYKVKFQPVTFDSYCFADCLIGNLTLSSSSSNSATNFTWPPNLGNDFSMTTKSDRFFFVLYPSTSQNTSYNASSNVFNITNTTFNPTDFAPASSSATTSPATLATSDSPQATHANGTQVGVGVGVGLGLPVAIAVAIGILLWRRGWFIRRSQGSQTFPEPVNGHASTIMPETVDEKKKDVLLPEAVPPSSDLGSTLQFSPLSPQGHWSAELEGDGMTRAELAASDDHSNSAPIERDRPPGQ